MIRIEPAKEIPIEELIEYSQEELLTAREVNGLIDSDCQVVYDDDKLLVVYAVRPGKNFLEPGFVHLLVGKAYNVRYARQTREAFKRLANHYYGLRTLIDVTYGQGCRFAKFLGLRPRGEPFDYAGRRFQLYEVY